MEFNGTPEKQTNAGSLRFSLGNILEMKVLSSDTINPVKKIKLIEGLNISSSYNLLADSIQFANIYIVVELDYLINLILHSTVHMTLIKSLMATEVNKYYFSETYLPGRLISANASLNFRLNGGKKMMKIT